MRVPEYKSPMAGLASLAYAGEQDSSQTPCDPLPRHRLIVTGVALESQQGALGKHNPEAGSR